MKAASETSPAGRRPSTANYFRLGNCSGSLTAAVASYQALFQRFLVFAEQFLAKADALDAVHDTMADAWSRWPVLSIEGHRPAFYIGAVRGRLANHRCREPRAFCG